MKQCEVCQCELGKVHHAVKYCEDCKKEAVRLNQKRFHFKHKGNNKAQKLEMLKENFYKVISQPLHLTGKGFNSISDYKCKTYVQTYKLKWIEILKLYDRFSDLENYIVDEYKIFVENSGKVNLHEFAKQSNFITYDLLLDIGIDEIKNKANILKFRYTEDEYKNNIIDITTKLGKPPLYNEFEENTKISINSYANRYNLKGKVYDEIMKLFLSDGDYNTYLLLKRNHKSSVGKTTGALSSSLTDEQLKEEFNRVFSHCLESYGDYPSKKLFNKLSKHDDSVYRGRYDRSWLDVCKMYGHNLEKNHKSEKMLLNMLSNILGEDYIPQKSWKWLIGRGGGRMYCDGYFPNFKLAIEFDGRQHRIPIEKFGGQKAFERLKENEILKEKLLLDNGKSIVRISSRDKWYDKNYLMDLLIENNIPIKTPTNQ